MLFNSHRLSAVIKLEKKLCINSVCGSFKIQSGIFDKIVNFSLWFSELIFDNFVYNISCCLLVWLGMSSSFHLINEDELKSVSGKRTFQHPLTYKVCVFMNDISLHTLSSLASTRNSFFFLLVLLGEVDRCGCINFSRHRRKNIKGTHAHSLD